MISLRTTGWLKPVLSLGVAFGLSTASMAADSTASTGTPNARAELQLADSGTTPAKPATKPSAKGRKHPLKRKLVKHAKVKSLHGKMGRKKGTSSHKGKKIHPPENKKGTSATT
jgi:hypothetical protein